MIVPAVLPKSRTELAEKLAALTRIIGVSRIQIDVVDGAFASPPSWPYAAHVGRTTSHMGGSELDDMATRRETLPHTGKIEYEIDLMCLDAEEAAGHWLALGASRLTFHAESIASLPRFFSRVKKRYGEFVSLGLALNIGTDPSFIEPLLPQLSYVQFMGIETIGRQGQPFNPRTVERVRNFHTTHPHMTTQVDGGVSLATAPLLLQAGVTDLIVGSAIVKAADPAQAFASFSALAALSNLGVSPPSI